MYNVVGMASSLKSINIRRYIDAFLVEKQRAFLRKYNVEAMLESL